MPQLDRNPDDTPIGIRLPQTDIARLVSAAEDLQRSCSALRGIASGIQYSIDSRVADGQELQSLLTVISNALDQDATVIMEGIMRLRGRRATDRLEHETT